MPSLASSTAPAKMAYGAGKNSKLMAPERTEASHAARSSANTQVPDQLTFGRIQRLAMTDRLVKAVSIAEELRQLSCQYLIPRTGKGRW